VVKFVEGAERWQRADADAVAEEDLGGAVDPRTCALQLGPVRLDEVDEPVVRTLQRHRAHQQDQHDHVREQSREPNNLRNFNSVCIVRLCFFA